MTSRTADWARRFRMSPKNAIVSAIVAASLAACSSPFSADVTRFQTQLPAPQGQTFAVVADDPALAGGLEFSQYAAYVADEMRQLGYTQAASPEAANLLVRFDYGVDKGRERVRSTGFYDPFYNPWYGYAGYRRGFYRGGPWAYGFYDPFFERDISSYTVFTSEVEMKIDRAADGERLFEGTAQALSTSNRLQYLVPNLVDAMFTDFPGRSGETVRISVAPEKTAAR